MAFLNLTTEPDLIAAMFASDLTFSQFESRLCGEFIAIGGEVSFLNNGQKVGHVYDFVHETYLNITFETRKTTRRNWQTGIDTTHTIHRIYTDGGTFCGSIAFMIPTLWNDQIESDAFSPANTSTLLKRVISFSFRELHYRIQQRGYTK